jgi:hypothetical protein
MEYRSLFGIGFVIFSMGYFVRSFQPANAFPQGPNISLGSNPIASFNVACNNSSPSIMSTTNNIFIITDVIVSDGYSTGGITLKLNGADWMNFNENVEVALQSGLSVPVNSSLDCYTYYGRDLVISGYYTHP